MDDGASDASSAPPPPAGVAVPAAPQHPVWQRAAGGGSSSKGAKAKAGTTTAYGKFAPISMAALELRARNEFDGSSSVGSERGHTKRSRSPIRNNEENDDQLPDYDEDSDDDGSEAASGMDVVAGAAFGGAPRPGATKKKSTKKKSKKDCTTMSLASDTDDGISITSSERRDAHCRAFPVTGVDCVGCALPAKVTAVDDFVRNSCDKMQEAALFKMAALVYQQKVAEPAIAEGVPVPTWAWKDIRAHYTLHRMDPKMQRFENMRTLAAMRKTLELNLLREDEASGEHVLDKGNAEQIMKIITLQSKEMTLLNEGNAGSKNSNQLPAGAASKKRD